jgi:hypothetical protein
MVYDAASNSVSYTVATPNNITALIKVMCDPAGAQDTVTCPSYYNVSASNTIYTIVLQSLNACAAAPSGAPADNGDSSSKNKRSKFAVVTMAVGSGIIAMILLMVYVHYRTRRSNTYVDLSMQDYGTLNKDEGPPRV